MSAFDVRAVTEHQVTNHELGLVEQVALTKNFLLWWRERDGSWNETAFRFPEYTVDTIQFGQSWIGVYRAD